MASVVTERGRIACGSVVLASGAWSRLFCGNLGIELPQLGVLGSVMRTERLDGGPEISAAGRRFGYRKRMDGGYTGWPSSPPTLTHPANNDNQRLRQFGPGPSWLGPSLYRQFEGWQAPAGAASLEHTNNISSRPPVNVIRCWVPDGGSERVNMNKVLLTVCAFWLLLSPAFAEENSPKQYPEEHPLEGQEKRVVASGITQRIDFYAALNPDCSAIGDVNVRVTKQPEHGTVESLPATDYPQKENIRSKCNDHKVRGLQVNYKSAEKYVGSDELELLVLFPGFAWKVRYNIDVR